MRGGWVVVIERTVIATEPRWPLIYGPFRNEDTAIIRRAQIVDALARADLDRDVAILPLDPGKTTLATIVEDAL